MLPPREMNTSCLRCRKTLADDERFCAGCGADRQLELAIAAELDPTIASLRRWLLVTAALTLGLSLILWEHYRHLLSAAQLWSMVGSTVLAGVALAVLAVLARRFPLPVSVMAASLFFLHWLSHLAVDPLGAVTPSLALVLRIMFAVVLVGAVNSGLRARALRQRAAEDFPRATARDR
ncbi:MAG TPA: hypothetical protein VL172_07195 [Kofleriaceae bacterium]|nr:hypothetical protein [Kofleriaceae bacterium]